MTLINLLLIVFSFILAIPTLVFVCQVFLAANQAKPEVNTSATRPNVAVLIPAHNETQVIVNTLRSILPQLTENDQLLVVADNCSDDTATLAKLQGAHVIERKDSVRRGKGYALDFGLKFLANSKPPDVVIVIDADCQISPLCIDTLARCAKAENRPVQSLYLMKAPVNKSVKQAIAEFAWLVKNQVRPLGLMRLGLPCQLMGTGMSFPWELLNKISLAHGNMVEDMKLGIDLALLGFAPSFCPNVLVTSEFPTSEQVTSSQRTRWEHGHLATIFTETPKLLKGALRARNLSLFSMALDLSIPPLSVLGLCLLIMQGFSLMWLYASDNALLFYCMTGLNGIFLTAVLVAWYRFGRKIVSFKSLCGVPLYMLRKIPIYLSFLIKREQGWVKTKR